MLARTSLDTPLGPFTLVMSEHGVVATAFGDELDDDLRRESREARRGLATERREVEAYFRGRLRVLETPVDLTAIGDGFPRRVLELVRTIPYGELWTYGDVAAAAGRPGAARAAGSALAHCPIEIFIPCHRVVPAGPGLGSYGGADDRRATLLRLEGAI